MGLRVRGANQSELVLDKVGRLIADIFTRSLMNIIGIDVSEEKSMVTILRSAEEIVVSFFEASRNPKELSDLIKS